MSGENIWGSRWDHPNPSKWIRCIIFLMNSNIIYQIQNLGMCSNLIYLPCLWKEQFPTNVLIMIWTYTIWCNGVWVRKVHKIVDQDDFRRTVFSRTTFIIPNCLQILNNSICIVYRTWLGIADKFLVDWSHSIYASSKWRTPHPIFFLIFEVNCLI